MILATIIASILMFVLGVIILAVGGAVGGLGLLVWAGIIPVDCLIWMGFTKKKRESIIEMTKFLVQYIQDNKAPFSARGVRPKVGQCGIFWEFQANTAF